MSDKGPSESRKIAIVVTSKLTARTFVAGFAQYMARQGQEVVLIADGIEERSETFGIGSVTQIAVPMHRDPSLIADVKSLILLTKVLHEISPQILLYATPKASLLSSIAGWILRIPSRIYQLWGLRLETVSGPKRTFLWLMEWLTSSLSSRVLANSQSLASVYERMGLAPAHSVDVLGDGSSHGVDLQRFSNRQSNPPVPIGLISESNSSSDQLVVGFVGRLHPDKGIDTLLDAARILYNQGISLRLILVGNNEGADLDLSGGIEDNTVVVGSVKDTRPYYAAMDVLVMPSLREGFPNVVLEAGAMGVPAIVSDGTGVIDSVIDDETGIIFPVKDAHSLAEAMKTLQDFPDIRIRLGLASQRRVEAQFDQGLVWERTLIYILNP